MGIIAYNLNFEHIWDYNNNSLLVNNQNMAIILYGTVLLSFAFGGIYLVNTVYTYQNS